ncbi:hypothetical protein THAOC_15354, partial [Thalassiosira oceanica]
GAEQDPPLRRQMWIGSVQVDPGGWVGREKKYAAAAIHWVLGLSAVEPHFQSISFNGCGGWTVWTAAVHSKKVP